MGRGRLGATVHRFWAACHPPAAPAWLGAAAGGTRPPLPGVTAATGAAMVRDAGRRAPLVVRGAAVAHSAAAGPWPMLVPGKGVFSSAVPLLLRRMRLLQAAGLSWRSLATPSAAGAAAEPPERPGAAGGAHRGGGHAPEVAHRALARAGGQEAGRRGAAGRGAGLTRDELRAALSGRRDLPREAHCRAAKEVHQAVHVWEIQKHGS
jgi:hypothetical protein